MEVKPSVFILLLKCKIDYFDLFVLVNKYSLIKISLAVSHPYKIFQHSLRGHLRATFQLANEIWSCWNLGRLWILYKKHVSFSLTNLFAWDVSVVNKVIDTGKRNWPGKKFACSLYFLFVSYLVGFEDPSFTRPAPSLLTSRTTEHRRLLQLRQLCKGFFFYWFLFMK